MVSVCLPSGALSQDLSSYLGFFYPGRGVSLHDCSSKVQLLLLTLDEGYLLTAAPPDLERGVAPLGPPILPAVRALWPVVHVRRRPDTKGSQLRLLGLVHWQASWPVSTLRGQEVSLS